MKIGTMALAGIAATMVPASAQASTVWDNGSAGASSNWCTQANNACGGSNWTIYDDFTVTKATRITGFTYDTFLNSYGYSATNFSFWNADPLTSFAQGAALSGTATGSVEALANGASRITVTGLDFTVAAGTHWLGFTDVLASPGVSSYRTSGQTLLGKARQSDGIGNFYNPSISDAAFSIAGAGAVPEPATWALMILGFGAVAGAMRRRPAARVRFA